MGAAIGAVIGAAPEIADLPNNILKWSQELVDSRESMAKWSGTIQTAMRMAERRQYMREIESGRETGGHATALSMQLQDIYDEVRPIKDAAYNLTATILIIAGAVIKTQLQIINSVDTLTGGVVQFKDLALGPLNWIVDYFKQDGGRRSVDVWADTMRNLRVGPQRPPRR